jgi:predicted Abi (CAAX) family protease
MADTIAAAHLGLNTIRTVLPERFDWQLFWIALALMAAPLIKIGWEFFVLESVKTGITEPSENFGCTRNPKN